MNRMARSKTPKPIQTWEEVDSQDEVEAPRLQGAARGLNSKNVINSSATLSVASTNPSTAASSGKHVTRTARNARPVNYDMKFHPMDIVTRPNSAAVRRRSKSISLPSQHSGDESDLSSLTLSESSEDEQEDEDEITSDSPVHQIAKQCPNLERKPDPRASRRSSRPEAKKPVNYSRKHHPQDYGLPGRRHSAILPPPSVVRKNKPTPSQAQILTQRKRRTEVSELTIPDSDEDDADAVESIPARLSDVEDVDFDGRPAKRRRRSDIRSQRVVVNLTCSSITDMDSDMDVATQLADSVIAAHDTPVGISSQESIGLLATSSSTLDGTVSPNKVAPAAFVFAIVRPYIALPNESHQYTTEASQAQTPSVAPSDSSDRRHEQSQTMSAQCGAEMNSRMTRQDDSQTAGSHSSVETCSRTVSEQRDTEANTSRLDDSLDMSSRVDAETCSRTMSEQCYPDASDETMDDFRGFKVNHLATRMSRSAGVESSPTSKQCAIEKYSEPTNEEHTVQVNSEQREPAATPPSFHFDEAIAITEQAISGDVSHKHNGDDTTKTAYHVEEVPLGMQPAGAIASSLSGSPDPIDLLPKFSSYRATDSLPSTAEPESDRTDSDAIEDTLSSIVDDLSSIVDEHTESDTLDNPPSAASLEL